jgi:peptidyl-prolyl cis-trans isomerase D
MLKVFRDNLKYLSWVLWGVILVFILFVFVDFGGGVPGPARTTESAATVGGDEISYGELQRAYRQAENTYRQAYGSQFTPELARQLQLPLQVLESLVQQRILLAEADRIGLAVSDGELQKELLKQPVLLDAQGNFVGSERYRQIIRSVGYSSPEAFEEEIRTQLLLAKLSRVIGDNVTVTDADVERTYRTQAERARIRFISVPVASFRGEEPIAADLVESHFQENIEAFRLPERRAVDYLLVDSSAIRETLSITDGELRTYYDEQIPEYATEEQVRARQIMLLINDERTIEQAQQELLAIRARIQGGEDFGALASELSEDPGSAPQGGDLGTFARGQILEEVEAAAFSAQPGELVGPGDAGAVSPSPADRARQRERRRPGCRAGRAHHQGGPGQP